MTLALLFSPQGAQVVGMGRELAERSAAARAAFEEADADARLVRQRRLLGWAGGSARRHASDATLPAHRLGGRAIGRWASVSSSSRRSWPATRSANTRPSSRPASWTSPPRCGWWRDARSSWPRVDADGGMAAVLGLDRETVQAVVDGVGRPTDLVLANDNAPGQVVISGRLHALEAVEEPLRAAGAKRVVRLAVSGAFHSPMMAAVVEDLADAFEAEEWRDARVPMISNVSAEPLTDAGRIRTLLAEQVRPRSNGCAAWSAWRPMESTWPSSAARERADRDGEADRPDMRTATVGDAAILDAAVELLGAGVPAPASA